MRNKFKQATEKAKKEYLEIKQDEIMEFQRTGLHDFMYIKMGGREKIEFQTLALKNLKGY
jgi:ribosomal protein L20A (L18A)